MFTKDPLKDTFEYAKTLKYHKKQLGVFKDNFPSLFQPDDIPFESIEHDGSRRPLLEISKLYSTIEKQISKQLNIGS